jgi:hypothetical protein
MPQARNKPESEKEQREQEKQEEQAQRDAEEKEEAQRGTAPQAGGTAGGASESQQVQEKQAPPASLPGSTEAELPEYDVVTASGVNPIQSGATTNPGDRYDDDLAGKPEDGQDEVDDDDDSKGGKSK